MLFTFLKLKHRVSAIIYENAAFFQFDKLILPARCSEHRAERQRLKMINSSGTGRPAEFSAQKSIQIILLENILIVNYSI